MEELCAELREYEKQFHEKDKRVEVQVEKMRSNRAVDISFGVGTALGGIMAGLAPYLWDKIDSSIPGLIFLLLGLALIAAAATVKAVKG